MYAVFKTGGKQYRVQANDTITVERLNAEVGEKLQLDSVLAVSDGKSLKIGTPVLEGASVTTTVVDHIRGDKVINYKKKRRKGYRNKRGHRQELSVIKIESINA